MAPSFLGLQVAGAYAWSPDGTGLASAQVGRDGRIAGVIRWRTSASDRFQGTPVGFAPWGMFAEISDVAWAPDGQSIAFAARGDGEDFDIWIADVETGDAVRVTEQGTDDRDPVFSPDAELVAFAATRLAARGIDTYVVPVGGGAPRLVLENAGHPDW